jgi:hypothetical protein
MAYAPDATPLRGQFPRSSKLDFGSDGEPGWGEPRQAPRDLKKLFLVAGLGILSWVATYVGMLELIEANMGDLPLIHKLIIGFSVAMLMTMIIWLLDQMFAPIGTFTKALYVAGYLFLTIISVGFGFGFYWKVLESRSESSRSAESAVSQVQGSLHAASTRLEQLNATLVQLAALSSEKAELERSKGTSCPNSKPGDGPRRAMREEDAQKFTFASDFVKGRVDAVKSEMSSLDGELAKIVKDDKGIIDAKTGTRNEFMKALGRKLDKTVTGFNAFRTDPQLRQLRSDLSDRADKTTFGDPKKGGFVCPDPQLQQALKGAVRAIDQLPELQKPEIAAVEGSEATIEAFRRLTATFYGMLSFKMPPSADELRELQKKAVQSVENAGSRPLTVESAGLSKRDYVPLAIAIFVDLCLLLVSMGRPVNRLHGLLPKMREAEQGPVIQILSRFNDIHRDSEIRQNFELFRHVVFDYHGDYYVAVPLDAPVRLSAEQRADLQHEAHLLANLFTSFEKERIFKRVYNPLLGTASIQKRLRRQGSKFAACEAFRTYRFRDGAWSEIILGAVMGAAKRVEAQKRRQMLEEELFRSHEPAFTRPAGPVRPPSMPEKEPLKRDPGVPLFDDPIAEAALSQGVLSLIRNPQDRSKFSPRPPEAEAGLAASYGAHGRHAQADLARSEREAAHAARAANNNTMPGGFRDEAKTAENVVPLEGVRPRPAPRAPLAALDVGMSAAGTAAAAVRMTEERRYELTADATPERNGHETFGVVLSREMATVALPAGEGALPDGIIRRLSEALSGPADQKRGTCESIDADPASAAAPSHAPVLRSFSEEPASEDEITDLSMDPDTEDAVGIAGRLRPGLPAQ